jgi:uncharacterized GH25 family protein
LDQTKWLGWKPREQVKTLTPTYCPGCQKFMGHVVPVEAKPAKKGT